MLKCAGKIFELRRMIIPSFGSYDVNIVAMGFRKFLRLSHGDTKCFGAIRNFSELAFGFDGKAHFFFFFFFS